MIRTPSHSCCLTARLERALFLAAAIALTLPTAAFAATYGWTLSASDSDPYANSATVSKDSLYLWFVSDTTGEGASFFQGLVRSTSSIQSFAPTIGQNQSTNDIIAILYSGCILPPFLAGTVVFDNPVPFACLGINSTPGSPNTEPQTIPCSGGFGENSDAIGFSIPDVTPCSSPTLGGSATAATRMYWGDTSQNTIEYATIAGLDLDTAVATGLSTPRGIAATSFEAGWLYWVDQSTDKIQRSNLDGSNIQDLYTSADGLGGTQDIALDVENGHFYFVDAVQDQIFRSNLDGTGLTPILFTGVSSLRGIAIDLMNDQMYWTDAGTAILMRADLDGSAPESLVTTGPQPVGIALDVEGNRIYWAELTPPAIHSSELDGSNASVLYDTTDGLGSPNFVDIDLVNRRLYWTDATLDQISRAPLDGSGPIETVRATGTTPRGFALLHEEVVKPYSRDWIEAAEYAGVRSTPSPTGYTRAAALGDIDGDGDLDLYLANQDLSHLYRNDGMLEFNILSVLDGGPPQPGINPRSAAMLDVEPDGDLDVLVVAAGANHLYRNDGAGSFDDATPVSLEDAGGVGSGVSYGDIDGDGDLDLYITNTNTNNRLYRNDSNGQDIAFADITTPPLDDAGSSEASVLTDLDGDGDLDLYIVNRTSANRLLRNDGGGSFADISASPVNDAGQGHAVAAGDADGDGDIDLYLVKAGANRLFVNQGGGSFTDGTVGAPLNDSNGDGRGAAFLDYDEDGDLDLYIANENGVNKLLRNDGGPFADVTAGTPLAGPSFAKGVVAGDLDGDRSLDLLVTSGLQDNALHLNIDASSYYTTLLRMSFDGSAAGVGATVRVVDENGNAQTRELSGGSGQAASGDPALVFAVKTYELILDSVVVNWPSGTIDCIADYEIYPSANLDLTVVEGSYSWQEFQIDVTLRERMFGAAAGDADGDGDLDLFVANETNLGGRYVRNDNGTLVALIFPDDPFPDVGGPKARSAAWADYDNDDDLDLAVGFAGSANILYRNDGNTFANVPQPDFAFPTDSTSSVSWADYDLDGDVDLFASNRPGPSELLRNDNGVFVATGLLPAGCSNGYGATWTDYDLDGDPDVLHMTESCLRILRNESGTAFVDVAPDILNPGSPSISENYMGAWGDYDNDRDFDLVIANTFIHWMNTNGLFNQVIIPVVGTNFLQWGDFDNDGYLDLYSSENQIYKNLGSSTFIPVTPGSFSFGARAGGSVLDYDGDGDLDLVTTQEESLYLHSNRENKLGDEHWLHVDLVGTLSNRSAIGSRVLTVANGTGQIREVRSGGEFRSMSSLTVEFGLGSATNVDSLVVYWPSGLEEVYTNVGVDQRLTIVEGDVAVGVDGTVSEGESAMVPTRYHLYSNAPNPFNPTTTIRYLLPSRQRTSLRIYDISGRLVRTLLDETAQDAGSYSVLWNGKNDAGTSVASGLYFYRLDAGRAYSETRRMMLVR